MEPDCDADDLAGGLGHEAEGIRMATLGEHHGREVRLGGLDGIRFLLVDGQGMDEAQDVGQIRGLCFTNGDGHGVSSESVFVCVGGHLGQLLGGGGLGCFRMRVGVEGGERLGDGIDRHLGVDLADRSARRRIPFDAEGGFDIGEHRTDRIRILDDDGRRKQPRPGDHTLRGADRLDPPGHIDAVFARAVFAGNLAEAGVDAQPPQHLDIILTETGEPCVGVRDERITRFDVIDDQRPRMVRSRTPAEAAQSRGETVVPSRFDSGGETGQETITGTEGQSRGRPVHPQSRPATSGLDRIEENAGEREVFHRAQAFCGHRGHRQTVCVHEFKGRGSAGSDRVRVVADRTGFQEICQFGQIV